MAILDGNAILRPVIRTLRARQRKLWRKLRNYPLFAAFSKDRRVSREQKFIESFDILESALDHLNQGLVMVDAKGHILIFNQRAVEYSGVSPRIFPWPAPAKDVFRVQWETGEFGLDGALLPDQVRQYFLTGSGQMPKSYVRRRPNGRVLEVRTEPLPNGGYVQTYSDITELVRAKEEAEAAARAKSDFLAAMSHEIRTPLNGVLGVAALLDKSLLTDEQRNWVRIILQSGDTLMSLINDILDFSKLETSAVEFDFVGCNLSALIQAALEVVEPQARSKALDLKAEIAPDVPQWVRADSKRLRQVLFNLLGNAVKFTDRGSVTLLLTRVGNDETNRLRFEIRDTGIGIAPEAQQRLFRKFSQVDASINRRFGGTGLGLAICKRIVEAMQGAIGVDSEDGVGSCFWFEIDAPVCEAEIPACTETTDVVAAVGCRILLVEDMAVNQIVARGMLGSLGHSVTIANDGVEALEILKNESFDVVLMDMQMPRMNGLDAARAIRAQGGDFAKLPIVAMTANAFHSDRSQCLAAGMNDFVAKPIELDALAAALRRVLPSAGDASAAEGGILGPLVRLAQFIGREGVRQALDDFRIESEELLRETSTAIAAGDLDLAQAHLEQLDEALAALGLAEPMAKAENLRRLLQQAARVLDVAVDQDAFGDYRFETRAERDPVAAHPALEEALEELREAVLRGGRDAYRELAGLPHAAAKQSVRPAAIEAAVGLPLAPTEGETTAQTAAPARRSA